MKWARAIPMFALPVAAFAHAGEPLQPHDLWTAWRFEPGIAIPLAIAAILYARGARTSRGITRAETLCFWSGWAILLLGLCSPVHPLGEVLFCAHMTQHELLMLGAAPLLVLARPLAAMLWGLPFEWRRAAGRWSKGSAVQRTWQTITAPFAAWLLHAIALWAWHIPYLFEATLRSDAVHAAQHISFLGTALLFWWSLFHGSRRREYGWGVLYIFTTGIHTSILGALLTFARTVWYPVYSSTAIWGLTPLEDQQVGGLIMWVPAGLVYVAAGLALFAAWMRESDLMVESRKYAQ
jgi:cytochrome c oxidase assembly factor CtaG